MPEFCGVLAGRRVVAFQRARLVLGDAFRAAVAQAAYREEGNQELQVRALFTDRCDVIVGERRILRHFLRATPGRFSQGQALVEHLIFDPIPYRVAFRDQDMMLRFNRVLADIRADGRLAQLIDRFDRIEIDAPPIPPP